MTSSTGKRRTILVPELIADFSARLRQIIANLGETQGKLARTLGGRRQDTISRLVRGRSTSISIDLLVSLARWADDRGYSVRWLLTGRGEMKGTDSALTDKDRILLDAIRNAESITIHVAPAPHESPAERKPDDNAN